jgi:putative DNA primase/helicase
MNSSSWARVSNPTAARPKTKPQAPQESALARAFLDVSDTLAFDDVAQLWMAYRDGIWRPETGESIGRLMAAFLNAQFPQGYPNRRLRNVLALARTFAGVEQWQESENLLPFENGVLDLKRKTRLPYKKQYRFTWKIPVDYDSKAKCEFAKKWMLEVCSGNKEMREVLRAALAAVLLGRYHLHRFFKIVGPGGSGKGTFVNLLTAIVGTKNAVSTSMTRLNESRFETGRLYKKRLALITDADKWGKSAEMLKAATGGDPLPYERKHSNADSMHNFLFQGLFVIVGNQPLETSDTTSGLFRRRCVLHFENQIPPDKRNEHLAKELATEIPGIVNWALGLPEKRMIDLIRNTTVAAPSLGGQQFNTLVETNTLAAWLDDNTSLAKDPHTQIGIGNLKPNREYPHLSGVKYKYQDMWLYPNYVLWCEQARKNPLTLVKFGRQLNDLCQAQLFLDGVKLLDRDRKGRHFQGIVIGNDGESPVRKALGIDSRGRANRDQPHVEDDATEPP